MRMHFVTVREIDSFGGVDSWEEKRKKERSNVTCGHRPAELSGVGVLAHVGVGECAGFVLMCGSFFFRLTFFFVLVKDIHEMLSRVPMVKRDVV